MNPNAKRWVFILFLGCRCCALLVPGRRRPHTPDFTAGMTRAGDLDRGTGTQMTLQKQIGLKESFKAS